MDPELPANRIIADLHLAPRNGRGRVAFSADFFMLKPRNPQLGNGSLLVEVPNRGNKYLLRQFNFGEPSNDPRTATHFGDGYPLEQGYTLVWVGSQFDVPDSRTCYGCSRRPRAARTARSPAGCDRSSSRTGTCAPFLWLIAT